MAEVLVHLQSYSSYHQLVPFSCLDRVIYPVRPVGLCPQTASRTRKTDCIILEFRGSGFKGVGFGLVCTVKIPNPALLSIVKHARFWQPLHGRVNRPRLSVERSETRVSTHGSHRSTIFGKLRFKLSGSTSKGFGSRWLELSFFYGLWLQGSKYSRPQALLARVDSIAAQVLLRGLGPAFGNLSFGGPITWCPFLPGGLRSVSVLSWTYRGLFLRASGATGSFVPWLGAHLVGWRADATGPGLFPDIAVNERPDRRPVKG